MRHGAQRRGKLLIFGTGFIGEHVARRAVESKYEVLGTTRRRQRAKELATRGTVQPLIFRGVGPLPEELIESELADVTHVLSTVPPSAGVDPVLSHHTSTLEACMPSLRWVGHISTAAVYGAQSAVDGSTVPRPRTASERMRLQVEREWAALSLPQGAAGVRIFRPSSVYGPWRGPQQLLRDGRAVAIQKPGHVASRVHVDDVAAIILASMNLEGPGGGASGVSDGVSPATGAATNVDDCPVEGPDSLTYVLADNEPAAPSDVILYTASLYGWPQPPTVDFSDVEYTLSAGARSFWRQPVRVSSASSLGSLGVSLAYPSFQEGLKAVQAAEGPPGAIAKQVVVPVEESAAPVEDSSAAPEVETVTATPSVQSAAQVEAAAKGDDEASLSREDAITELLGMPSDSLAALKVVELKRLLRPFGLRLGGKKAQLVERLADHKQMLERLQERTA
jgi:nucleoside-diphosphate-sugar epimerase